MKKLSCLLVAAMLFTLFASVSVFGMVGDLGFFGGISEGRRLPKTTELIYKETGNAKKDDYNIEDMPYKEVLFIAGQPVEFEGLIDIKNDEDLEDAAGQYEIQYTVKPLPNTDSPVSIDRDITYSVTYAKTGNQITKNFEMTDWEETITINGAAYVLSDAQSHSDVSIIEDHTPGVTYYKGNLSHVAVYTATEADNAEEGGDAGAEEEEGTPNTAKSTLTGTIYGYTSAWSNAETHRIDGYADTPAGQLSYQIRPSVSVSKTLQYSKNEPTAISFDGNYTEVMQNKSMVSYDIFISPRQYQYVNPASGNASLDTVNSFEQLIAPDVAYLKGHFAESDISKLFSMQILEGDPKFYQPSQAITRGQFVTALVKAVKLPTEQPQTTGRGRRQNVVEIVFPDVLSDRPDYPYIMAAYKAGLAVGRDNGHFYIDSPIERQEAIVILIRTLGLESLGLDTTPMTPFADDRNIADWAKREVYAANRVGIIMGDQDGNFRPRDYVSKAEAAAFVNRLVDYMRSDLQTDYTEHIVNYTN